MSELETQIPDTLTTETQQTDAIETPDAPQVQTAVSEKLFTQADIDKLIKERLDREKVKSEKAIAAAKAEAERQALEAQGNYQKLYEAEKAQREAAINEMKALHLANMRREVATAYNVPNGLAARLVGETREDLEADAKELMASLPKASAPSLDGLAGGSRSNGKPGMTDDEKRELAAQLGVKVEYL